MRNNYYVGPAGWSYKDWEGIVYPPKKEKNFQPLKYISQYFNTVEINSSFYRPPTAQTTQHWIALVAENPKFSFTYKLWQEFTHNRHIFPSGDKEKLVKAGLDRLLECEKLGALLIQFPWSFKNMPDNRDWLNKVIELFGRYHPVVEVRHQSWNSQDFFNDLKDKNVGFANIDQPVIGKSIALSAISTSDVAYLRLHGRNYENWFKDNVDAAARYDYLYQAAELSDLSATINLLIENNPKTYIIFNNHYRGQAIANALQTKFLLEKQTIPVPLSLILYFPELSQITMRAEQPEQISIFNH